MNKREDSKSRFCRVTNVTGDVQLNLLGEPIEGQYTLTKFN